MASAANLPKSPNMVRHFCRIPVEHVPGNGLFAGDVHVSASSAPYDGRAKLSEETREALDLTKHARLIVCDECKARFISYFAVRRCSPECHAAVRRKFSAKMTAKRSEFRAQKRQHADDDVYCKRCGNRAVGAQRRTRLFCSNACRQAAFKVRRRIGSPAAGGVSDTPPNPRA